MSDGARAGWSKRGCGDSHRREPGKHKHRKCERPLSAQPSKPVIVRPGSKRCVMSGADVEVYLSQVHDGSVSSGFRALYEERLLLDVTLLIEEHHFQAHKALLATQSDYFRVMFTADMRERDQDKIHMKGLTAAGFGHILRFMYYGSLELSMPTVQEILQAAMYVQLTEAVEFCCSFLLAKICLENCAEVMRLLEDFSVGVEGVQEQLDNFLLENFVPLMSRPDFLSYLSLERLQAYLNSDALSRFPEIELYEAVQAWLRHDRRRWRHTDTIVQSIRFCLMTPANIFEKVKTSEFYRYSRQLRQEVDQALSYFHDVNQQPLVETRSNRIRSVRPQTAVFRGMIGHSMVNSKILLLQRPKVWWELEGPQVPLRPDCLAIVNNFAFLLGGEELGPDGEFHASSKVYRYDPRQNSWLRMADMSVPRSEFAVGVIGKFIYAVAGRTRDETFYSTERYDITEDRWEFVDPYPVNKYGHEGTVLSGKLYITGGITSSSTSKQVCVFDPGREAGGGGGGGSAGGSDSHRTRAGRGPLPPGTHGSCWENKSKMNYARCFHKMISHNGKLYVFGGVCVILRASFESQGCPSTEVYNPETDEWTILASMPIGRSGHGVAVLDRQIMVLGGLCYNGHYSDSILTFDPEENKWKEDEYPRMPCKLDGLQVCSLHFPEYVLEHVRRCS
ncbi:kelch-like protein 15 isoform X1 [Archocentrus centrarchus]|uniref:kelch-like protein 15 isoform X1 n=1 Tax=Archocentrus centrarchus TaxID=63155 RepID=UPI0011E9C09D|nr:kelch-like protein 15 isoform X1 [Archocentrus centrarchus]